MKYLVLLVILFIANPVFAVETAPLNEQDCLGYTFADERADCYTALAEQEKNALYCKPLESWASAKKCLYYADRAKKLNKQDCELVPQFKDLCLAYVETGILSKPGQSYEDSQKN